MERTELETLLKLDPGLYRTIYSELRRIAGRLIARESARCTLTPTELVHEVYLKLSPDSSPAWANRAHFVAHAAVAMRYVLVDHARKKLTTKRGAGWTRVSLSGVEVVTQPELEVLELNDALEEMARLSPRTAQIVELRVFGGLTAAESAELLGISRRTADTDWRFARLWLSDRLQP